MLVQRQWMPCLWCQVHFGGYHVGISHLVLSQNIKNRLLCATHYTQAASVSRGPEKDGSALLLFHARCRNFPRTRSTYISLSKLLGASLGIQHVLTSHCRNSGQTPTDPQIPPSRGPIVQSIWRPCLFCIRCMCNTRVLSLTSQIPVPP